MNVRKDYVRGCSVYYAFGHVSVSQATANRGERVAKMSMIVPTETLVKYDNPTLVSKNTDKRTKVSIKNSQFLILSAKKF